MLIAPFLAADISAVPSLPIGTGVAVAPSQGEVGVPLMLGLGGHLTSSPSTRPIPFFVHGHVGLRTGNGAHSFRGEVSMGAAAVFDVVWLGGFVEPWLTKDATPGLGMVLRGGFFGLWLGAGWDQTFRPSLEPSSLRFELGLDLGTMAYFLAQGIYIPR